MNTSYKKILNKSKLILSDFDIESFSQTYLIKMLINNDISGLLSTELNLVNSCPILSYDITSKHSVMSVLENKKVDYSLFSSIMQGLHRLCYTLNDFMLDNCYLLLSPEYIFLDGSMRQAFFCYCPVCENNSTYSLSTQLRLFLEYIISKLNYDDRDCVAHVYSLHQKCINDSLCPDDLIYNLREESAGLPDDNLQEVYNNASEDSINRFSENTFYTDNNGVNFVGINSNKINPNKISSNDDIFVNNNAPFYICGLPAGTFLVVTMLGIFSLFTIIFGLYMYFIRNAISPALALLIGLFGPVLLILYIPSALRKRTGGKVRCQSSLKSPPSPAPEDFSVSASKKALDNIMPIGETVLINPNKALAVPHLVYNGSDFCDDIELTDFPFTIGKLSDTVNHIMDNALISRIHARFYLKEDCYYVEDLNSSNGTYVNNVPLSPHTMTEIHDGDCITFACLTYIFKLC